MAHRFLVLHFGGQCPWHLWVIEQARQAAAEVAGTVEAADVSNKPELAAHYRLFSPFMTVIDDTIRLPSPTSSERLVKMARQEISSEPTVFKPSNPELRVQKVVPLTAKNIGDACSLCIPARETAGCPAKQMWASRMRHKVRDGKLGFIAYEEGEAVAAVEFLPAPVIPYPLPEKESAIAFITCIYSSSADLSSAHGEGLDYRGQVLEHLLRCLPGQGYTKVQVIAGRRTPYPNGPVPFFLSHGFEELIELDRVVLTVGQEEFVLLEKDTTA